MLEVTNLTKVYGATKSVSGLTFQIGEGETVGLLGPNGAGKSTTMRMLTGYISPTAGSVTMLGKSLADQPLEARRHIGYLPELPPLYLNMTVTEHLAVVCSLRGIPKARAADEISRVCGSLHITDVKGRVIKHLSKGYRQRVGFAAALVGDPKLLILDEPTVGLDPRQVIEIRGLIQELSGRMSILISSHILSEIASVCSRILIMNKGRLLADGSPAEIERRHGGRAGAEVVVRGDSRLAGKLLTGCLEGRAGFTATPGPGQEETRFEVAADSPELRGDIFRAFAAHSDKLLLVSLRPLSQTLEDIFIHIIQNSSAES